jgi:hypothetical protein
MNKARHDFFSNAALAGDEDFRVATRSRIDLTADKLDDPTLANEGKGFPNAIHICLCETKLSCVLLASVKNYLIRAE